MMVESAGGLRILYVGQAMPYPPDLGVRWALYASLSYLAPRHQLKLVCRGSSETDEAGILERRVGCQEVITFDPAPRREWPMTSYLSDRFFRECQSSRALRGVLPPLCRWAQVVQVESLELALDLVRTLAATKVIPRPVVVFRAHEIMSRYMAHRFAYYHPIPRGVRRLCPPAVRRAFHRRRVAQYRRLERFIYRSVDAVVVFSHDDAAGIREEYPDVRVHHIPMGIDLHSVHSLGRAAARVQGPFTLTFVGGLQWPPNVDAAMVLVRDILPHLADLDIRVLIVGSHPPAELRRFDDGRRVQVRGYVPDIESVWRETDIAVIPVRFGAGVKTKTIDALAHGIPVITSAMGRSGVEGTPGTHFLQARTPEEFARSVRALVGDPTLYATLSNNGRKIVEERHSLTVFGSCLESLYVDLIERRTRSSVTPRDPEFAREVAPEAPASAARLD